MRISQLVTGVVLVLSAVWLVATLVSLVLAGPALATVVVVAIAVLAVGAASVVGERARRSRSNPYW